MANNAIASVAISCAWPRGTSLSKCKYTTGKPYGSYKSCLNQAYPSRKNWGPKPKVGCSCDVFSGTCIRCAGADSSFPRGLDAQIPWLKNHSGKWKRISRGSTLMGGDVQVRYGGHIRIVVELSSGKYVAEAHYKSHGGCYGMIGGKASHGSYTTYRSTVLANDGSSAPDSSSSSSSSSTAPYKEYYVTKPTEITHIKDAIYISEEPTLTKSIRVKTLTNDWNNIKTFYASQASVKLNNLLYTYELSVESLMNEYNYIKNIMDITPFTNDSTWKKLYNNICIKTTALTAYFEASQSFIAINATEAYQEYYDSNITSYDDEISNYYDEMQNYLNEMDESIDISADYEATVQLIKEVNDQILIIQNKLNNYNNYNDINVQINKYEVLLDNLQDYLVNFKIDNFSDIYTYWNKNIIQRPNLLNYWLEFLDNNSDLEQYSITNIGNHSYTVNNTAVSSIYNKNVPQIIYYTTDTLIDESKTGYSYLKIDNESLTNLFINSAQGTSAKDTIDDLLYQYSYCSQEINCTFVPIYYLEPNTRILIYDKNTQINNEYIISKIGHQLASGGTSSITATKVESRLY